MLELEPPTSRYGRVFVGSPQQARGRTFRVVFVPGLAERMFPQKPHEDPMLLDREMRAPLGAGLRAQEDRARTERLLLRLAVGAPTERLWLSYPRLEVGESRPRVPSLLCARRHARDHRPHPAATRQLQERRGRGRGRRARVARARAAGRAIDDFEHDLAVLRELLQVEPPATVQGPRALPAAPERVAQAIGHRAVGRAAARSGRRTTASRASPA